MPESRFPGVVVVVVVVDRVSVMGIGLEMGGMLRALAVDWRLAALLLLLPPPMALKRWLNCEPDRAGRFVGGDEADAVSSAGGCSTAVSSYRMALNAPGASCCDTEELVPGRRGVAAPPRVAEADRGVVAVVGRDEAVAVALIVVAKPPPPPPKDRFSLRGGPNRRTHGC